MISFDSLGRYPEKRKNDPSVIGGMEFFFFWKQNKRRKQIDVYGKSILSSTIEGEMKLEREFISTNA